MTVIWGEPCAKNSPLANLDIGHRVIGSFILHNSIGKAPELGLHQPAQMDAFPTHYDRHIRNQHHLLGVLLSDLACIGAIEESGDGKSQLSYKRNAQTCSGVRVLSALGIALTVLYIKVKTSGMEGFPM